MLPGLSIYPLADALPVVVVLALSGIVAMAIAAWLVHAVARRAIEKTTPESVASVIFALGALLNSLCGIVPWTRSRHTGLHDGHVFRPKTGLTLGTDGGEERPSDDA
jgi:hypothetical protein